MSNIVEFALKMKDMASQQLRSFGTAANQTFTQVNSMVNNLSSHNRVLGQSYNLIAERIREVENTIKTSTIPSQIRAARQELEQLQRKANSHPGNISGGSGISNNTSGGGMMGKIASGAFLGNMVQGIATKTLSSLGGFLTDSISQGMERQQVQTSFNVLAGGEKQGSALTKQLVDLQKDTVLGSEVFSNAQTMLGFGFKSEEILPNMKMLGDVAMGDAQKLGSLTLAFSQIRAAGKLGGQDLLQLINAGFNPLETMAQKTGKSIGKLKEQMSKGNISFKMVQQAFQDATGEGGRFENMLEKIAETPAGKMQQLSGAWDEFKISAGNAFMPLVSFALDLASKFMPLIENLITPLSQGVQNVVEWIKNAGQETGGWMNYVAVIKDYFTDHLIPLVTKLWNTIVNIVSKWVNFIKNSELLQDVFSFIYKIVGWIADGIGLLIDGLAWLFENVVMPIVNAIEKAYRFIKGSKQETSAGVKVQQYLSPEAKKEEKTNQEILGTIAKNTADNNSSSKGSGESISKGGQKVINISVSKFLDYISINPTTFSESATDVERIFLELFSRVVTQGAS
jgi:tape measure domain-containing protein